MNLESAQSGASGPPRAPRKPRAFRKPVTVRTGGAAGTAGAVRFARACAFGCLVALAGAACSGNASAPSKPAKSAASAEQAAAAQVAQEEREAAARMAAEQDALAKQAEEEEAKRAQAIEKAKLPAEFGTPSVLAEAGAPAPGPDGAASVGAASAGAPPAGAPGEAADEVAAAAAPKVTAIAPVLVPEKLPPPQAAGAKPYDEVYPQIADRVVRIGIVSGSSQAASAQNLARMLSGEDRKYMEETLGLGVQIAYVSETGRPEVPRTRVRYRPQFLKAAVHIAALLPEPQLLGAMSDAEAASHGVDVLVQIGTELR